MPVDNGLTETAQHQVSQTAGPHNAAPVLHFFPVRVPAPASQQSYGDSSTISYARVSVYNLVVVVIRAWIWSKLNRSWRP